MGLINHQSNGAKGLRIAATVCVCLGWVALLFCFVGGIVAEDVPFIGPFAIGVATLGVMYLSACVIRGFSCVVEAAQLYRDNNTPKNENAEQ